MKLLMFRFAEIVICSNTKNLDPIIVFLFDE